MGNESSTFETCEWDDATTDGLWTIYQGILADDTEITRFNVSKNDKRHHDVLRRQTKNLKLVRHPSILTYLYSNEGSHGPELVTEKAIPLEDVLTSLSSTEICAGLHSILDALRFLHVNVESCHNNVHTGSVYVTADGSWRLSGLEHMCKFSECSNEYLQSLKDFRNETVITPEEKQGKVPTDVSLAHTRDIFAFAAMTESLLEKLDDLGDLTKTFELRIQDECLNSDPKQRPSAQSLLSDRIFNTEFLEIALFLKNITLKSETERRLFFRNLLPKLLALPEELTARRLVPSMLSRFVFLDQSAVENVLPSVLTPRKGETVTEEGSGLYPLFSEKIYKRYVSPKLVKIFSVHDYHVHMILLQYFHKYVHLIDREDLEIDVFPQVLLGLRDTSDQIASLSLHALAEMVPVLGRDVVIGGKSKTYFKEGLPKSQSMIPNNKYSNVRSMAEKIKLVDLAKERDNGKPICISKKDDDNDRKWKEREQRREEMKRKREERQKARQKSRAAIRKISENESDQLESPRDINDTTQFSDVNLNDTDDHMIQNGSHDVSGDSPVTNESKNSNKWSDDNMDDSVHIVEPEVCTNDIDDDWTGWSDNEEVESNYSEDIEKELATMETVSNVLKEPESNSIPNKISISKSSNQGALKLASSKPKNDVKKEELEVDKLVEDTKRKAELIKPLRNITTKKSDNLGSEFDIMNLDIKVSKPESDPFDFFADMVPKIESNKVTQVDNSDIDTVINTTQESASKSQLSFSVQAENIEDNDTGGGWGDDEDW
ncbi:Protein-associating with the carboxyl-terminal domain of ezrin [Mactra antiquata]